MILLLIFAADDDDDDSPVESAKREFTMRTSQTAVPLLATADNDYITPPPAPPPDVSTMYRNDTLFTVLHTV